MPSFDGAGYDALTTPWRRASSPPWATNERCSYSGSPNTAPAIRSSSLMPRGIYYENGRSSRRSFAYASHCFSAR